MYTKCVCRYVCMCTYKFIHAVFVTVCIDWGWLCCLHYVCAHGHTDTRSCTTHMDSYSCTRYGHMCLCLYYSTWVCRYVCMCTYKCIHVVLTHCVYLLSMVYGFAAGLTYGHMNILTYCMCTCTISMYTYMSSTCTHICHLHVHIYVIYMYTYMSSTCTHTCHLHVHIYVHSRRRSDFNFLDLEI